MPDYKQMYLTLLARENAKKQQYALTLMREYAQTLMKEYAPTLTI